MFHTPPETLVRGPLLPDIFLDTDYRLDMNRRSEVGAIVQPPFPATLSLRKADYEIDLDAPGFAETVDAMFSAHDKNGDGVVTADEYVDPIVRPAPDPNGEAIVRRLIEELTPGLPDHDRLSHALAQVTLAQAQLGEFRDVTLVEVAPMRGVYDIVFADKEVTYTVVLSPDGTVFGESVRPKPAPGEGR